jgi:hypothetical protein
MAILRYWFKSKPKAQSEWTDYDFMVWVDMILHYFPDPYNGMGHVTPNYNDASDPENRKYRDVYEPLEVWNWGCPLTYEELLEGEKERLEAELAERDKIERGLKDGVLKLFSSDKYKAFKSKWDSLRCGDKYFDLDEWEKEILGGSLFVPF